MRLVIGGPTRDTVPASFAVEDDSMIPQRFYTYVAVTDLYWQQCGEVGVLDLFKSTFAKSVSANGGYSPVLDSYSPLSSKQAKAIGLTLHKQATWYRLDGSGIQGAMVGAGVAS